MRTLNRMKKMYLLSLVLPALVVMGGFFQPNQAQYQKLPPLDPPKSVTFPKVVSKTLPNQLRVYVVEDHSLPIVALQLVTEAGSVTSGTSTPGLAFFTARMLDQGTQTRSAQDIAGAIDSIGGTLSASAAYESAEISSAVLTEHSQLGFELVADLVQNAAFKPQEIERLREQLLGELQVEYGTPSFVADTALRRLVFGMTPAGTPLVGTPDTLKKLTRAQVINFYKQNYIPNTSFLVVGGDISPDEAFARAEKAFGTWKPGKAQKSVRLAQPAMAKQLQCVVIDKPGAAQTEVRVGHPGITQIDPRYFQGLVMNSVLGDGYSARLNKEIRIKRGLSYGARSNLVAGRGIGLFRTRCSTKAQSTFEVVQIFLDEMKRIQAEAIADEELATRKLATTGDFVQELQSIQAVMDQVATTIHLGQDLKTLDEFIPKVNAVTVAQAQDFANRQLNVTTPMIVLVGDYKVFEKDLTALKATPTIIKMGDFDPLQPKLAKATKAKK